MSEPIVSSGAAEAAAEAEILQPAGVDRVVPGQKWEFDQGVTAVFENMLHRSIPQYGVMRKACFDMACRHVAPKTAIVDLGCSRGDALQPFVDKFGGYNRYVGVEVSDPMLEAARDRFRGYISCGVVDVRKLDLRTDYPKDLACVTLSVLTLQFVPIEYRQRILRDAYKNTAHGGCLILVEKVLGATAELDRAMVDLYYDLKHANGYGKDDIERKRLSLEGVLVPVTAAWNEELLKMAGFRQVDCFWRWMNFAGWVAVKE